MANPRALYLDDDPDSCEMMKLLLSTSFPALSVEALTSGTDALKLAQTAPFDLYILDAIIPGMSGFEVCKEIRLRDGNVPVYFYTGLAGQEFRQQAQEAGCTGFLVKPNDMDELLKTVEHAIKKEHSDKISGVGHLQT
jgi:CheY-like chemotaxis protein